MTILPTLHNSSSLVHLYALLLKLRPIQSGTLMLFSGELVHGAFLHWMRAAAPDVVEWLHEGQKRRLFTCSSLHFSQPMQPHLTLRQQIFLLAQLAFYSGIGYKTAMGLGQARLIV